MAEAKENLWMEKVVSLCKRRGFIYPSSEIYGGINGFWDYGPLGAELKRNVKELWWRSMTRARDDVVGLEATIIMHPQIWRASGHVDTFADLMRECPLTRKRVRADQVEPRSGIAFVFGGARSRTAVTDGLTRLVDAFRKAPPEEGNPLMDEILSLAQKMADRWEDREERMLLVNQLGQLGLMEQARELRELVPHDLAPDGTSRPFIILLPPGKPVESALARAREFYSQLGVKEPEPIPLARVRVEHSVDFHPESDVRLTEARPFNLMFKTYVGPLADEDNVAYLRPETAQAIFVQFKNVFETSRQKIPFGIAQIGKAFRNEVTPRNFTFRSREFEQMELEFFIRPDEAVEAIHGRVATPSGPGHPGEPRPDWGWQLWHQYWVEERIRFYESIGLPRTTLEEYWQKPEELAHYARATVDILFKFPFGTQELEGIAARGDFDLSQHQRFSSKPMNVFDEELKLAWARLEAPQQAMLSARYEAARLKYLTRSGENPETAAVLAREDALNLARGSYVPHVIEPSAGVDRLILALITHAFHEEELVDEKGRKEVRTVLRFQGRIAPVTVGVFPLLKNRPELVARAREVRDLLRHRFNVFYDEGGSIGRRYARQDEAGTPFGVTIDFDTLGEKPELKDTVTLRFRDDGRQIRLPIPELATWLESQL